MENHLNSTICRSSVGIIYTQIRAQPATSKQQHGKTWADQVIVTSPGDGNFDAMSGEMEGLLKAANANLQSAGIREARASCFLYLFLHGTEHVATMGKHQAHKSIRGGPGGVKCAACFALRFLHGKRQLEGELGHTCLGTCPNCWAASN